MPLCPQITITPITVTSTNMTVTSVVAGGDPATVETVATVSTDANQALIDAAAAQADAAAAIADAATAISTANTAYSTAVAANTAASVAQTTADGKNKVTYSTSTPGSTANTSGDIWYQYGTSGANSGRIIAQYMGDGGTSWTQTTVSGLVIANIDAGNITTGTLTASVGISNPSGNFSVNGATGQLVCSNAIVSGNITATSGTFTGTVYASAGTFTGTVTATSGSFTGTVTANAGTIGGFSIASGYMNYGSTYFYSSGNGTYALIDNSRSISASRILATGGASNALTVTGGGTFSSSVSMTGLSCSSITNSGTTYSGGDITCIGGITTTGTINVNSGSVVLYGSTGNIDATGAYSRLISGRTLLVNSGGGIGTSSSSRTIKQDIADANIDPTPLLDLPLQQFRYIADVEENGDNATVQIGLMAEDVAAAGLEYLIDRDKDGNPNYIFWTERMPQALLQLIQNQAKQIEALEARVTALESK